MVILDFIMLSQFFYISGRLPYPKLKQPQLPDRPYQDDKVCVLSQTSTSTNHTSVVASPFLQIHLLVIVDQLQ